jgi:hypothetical protein
VLVIKEASSKVVVRAVEIKEISNKEAGRVVENKETSKVNRETVMDKVLIKEAVSRGGMITGNKKVGSSRVVINNSGVTLIRNVVISQTGHHKSRMTGPIIQRIKKIKKHK